MHANACLPAKRGGGDIMCRRPEVVGLGGVGVADYALFIGFGAVVRGREKQAVKVFGESVQYYAELKQKGVIESFEPFLLEPHGGDLAGFILIQGDKDKLAHLRVDPEFERRTTRAASIVDGVGVITAYSGGRLAEAMGSFIKDTEDLV